MSGYRDSNGNWHDGDGSVTSCNGVQLGILGTDIKPAGDGKFYTPSGHMVDPNPDFPYYYDITKPKP